MFYGTEYGAGRKAKELDRALSKEEQDAGWWHEVREEWQESPRQHARRGRGAEYRRDNSRR